MVSKLLPFMTGRLNPRIIESTQCLNQSSNQASNYKTTSPWESKCGTAKLQCTMAYLNYTAQDFASSLENRRPGVLPNPCYG